MKKKSKKKTNLKSSVMLLLLLLILLIVSTYAWFTANKTVTISEIDVNVAATNGLQISVDASEWKTILQNADITGVTYSGGTLRNQIPVELKPVSTILNTSSSSGLMDMYLGDVQTNSDGNFILTTTQSVEGTGVTTTGDFVAFDIYLKVDQDTTVYLTSASQVVYTASASQGLENAARVAFVYEGHVATGTAASTAQALTEASDVILWEPNYDTHTAAGVSNASSVYSINTTQTGGNLLEYNGVKGTISADANVLLSSTDSTYFSKVTPDIYTANGYTSGNEFTTLSAGITKYRVYMWVEGQDVDCENNASGTSIGYTVQFSTENS